MQPGAERLSSPVPEEFNPSLRHGFGDASALPPCRGEGDGQTASPRGCGPRLWLGSALTPQTHTAEPPWLLYPTLPCTAAPAGGFQGAVLVAGGAGDIRCTAALSPRSCCHRHAGGTRSSVLGAALHSLKLLRTASAPAPALHPYHPYQRSVSTAPSSGWRPPCLLVPTREAGLAAAALFASRPPDNGLRASR